MSADVEPKLDDAMRKQLAEKPAATPFSELPRRERRRIAKRAKLFKDPSREAWRIASDHMKRNGAPRHTH